MTKSFTKVIKPWGWYQNIWQQEGINVKIIHLNDGQRTSLQSHIKRMETWVPLDNKCLALIELGTSVYGETEKPVHPVELLEGQHLFVYYKCKHRLEAIDGDVNVLEISYGIHDEEDITRYEDDYGR